MSQQHDYTPKGTTIKQVVATSTSAELVAAKTDRKILKIFRITGSGIAYTRDSSSAAVSGQGAAFTTKGSVAIYDGDEVYRGAVQVVTDGTGITLSVEEG